MFYKTSKLYTKVKIEKPNNQNNNCQNYGRNKSYCGYPITLRKMKRRSLVFLIHRTK